jgi:two-component system, NtrC family, response regulator AtoC
VTADHDTLATQRGSAGAELVHRYLAVFEAGSSRVVPLPDSGELVVGRGDEAGLRIDDAKTSRRHARIVLTPAQVIVADLESQNGTLLNGEALRQSHALVSGDVIEIGRAALVFHASPAGPPSRTSAGLAGFQQQLAAEVERATLAARPLALVCIAAEAAPAIAAVEPELCGVERVAPDGDARLLVLLPEASAADATARARSLLATLADARIAARAGIALHPADGCDADTLVSSARAAAADAPPSAVREAAATFRLLQVGDREIVLADAAMLRLYALVERLAAADLPVLVHGETGSGKEIAAQALHYFSPRRQKRIVAINCAALQETLVESELFGHEKGAFTGALTSKPGLLEMAAGGTVLLDEIGELPQPVQAKLLRALDTGRIVRVGDVHERAIDVRVVAATHKDLEREVADGRFRQDLYFRLGGATLWVPPLRDRPRELAMLAQRFLDAARTRAGKRPMRLGDETLRLCASYGWPGNVRELKNVMEFAAAAFDDPLLEPWQLATRLPGAAADAHESEPALPLPSATGFRPLEDEIRDLERTRIQQALDAAGGNQRRAAQLIGMPRRTFVSKLTQLGLRDRGPAGR